MDKRILDYMQYGIYQNTIYYPRNKAAITEYMEELRPLRMLLEKSNKSDVILALKKEDPNIFIVSLVVASIGFADELWTLITNKVKHPTDCYIFSVFMSLSDFPVKKNMVKFYETADLGDYVKECFSLFKPNLKTKKKYASKEKYISSIKQAIESRTIKADAQNILIRNNIHFSSLETQMSYSFDRKVKDSIVRGYIDKYGIFDVLRHIDEWYCDGLSDEISEYIHVTISKIYNSADLFRLMVLEKDIQNKSIKNMILNHFNESELRIKETSLNINISPSHKHKTKIGQSENYDYLFLFALMAVISNKILGANTVLNGEQINDASSILKTVDGKSAALKPESIIDENKINILFSGIMQDDFDIVWDCAVENGVNFTDAGPLMVFGSSRFIVESMLSYIYDGRVVKRRAEVS